MLKDENASTSKYKKHEACGYAYKRVSTVDTYDKPIELYCGDSTESVAEHLLKNPMKYMISCLKSSPWI